MKKELIGYITGLIDNYTREIKCLKIILKPENSSLKNRETFKSALTDLLEFVEDIPEEEHLSRIVQDCYTQVIIKNMEGSIEREKALHKRIEELVRENDSLWVANKKKRAEI